MITTEDIVAALTLLAEDGEIVDDPARHQAAADTVDIQAIYNRITTKEYVSGETLPDGRTVDQALTRFRELGFSRIFVVHLDGVPKSYVVNPDVVATEVDTVARVEAVGEAINAINSGAV